MLQVFAGFPPVGAAAPKLLKLVGFGCCGIRGLRNPREDFLRPPLGKPRCEATSEFNGLLAATPSGIRVQVPMRGSGMGSLRLMVDGTGSACDGTAEEAAERLESRLVCCF